MTTGYRLVRALARTLLRLFFRRIVVVGAERLPRQGPLIIAANHHNAIVDGMLIVAGAPRPVMALAKAPLFDHPLLGPFLRMMSAVPVNRRTEAGDDPRKNEAMFAAAIAALRQGGALLIFPEGRSQPQPTLLPVHTGAARILLGAETAESGAVHVTLLPIGLVFHDPGTFRSASVEMMIGAPVETADLVVAYRDRPADAVHELTARLAEALRMRIVEAEDQHTLELLAVLERAWREETAAGADSPEHALAWKQQVMRAGRQLADEAPQRVADVRRRAELYRAHLAEVGITSAQLGQPYTARLVASYVADNALWLGLGLPLALWGLACHAPPYWVTGRVVARLPHTPEEEATHKMAAGLVLYPAGWAAEGALIWWLLGPAALVVFALLLVPSGLLALAWRERLGRVVRQARAFVWFLTDRDLHRRLLAERRALVAELRALGGQVRPRGG
jgi:1-acyl-sn-glycerol-3-phosphate acyltransferase